MAMNLNEIETLIKEAMPDAIVEIQDLAGDGNHYSATITSSQFSGKSKIEQHKMVYNSLKGSYLLMSYIPFYVVQFYFFLKIETKLWLQNNDYHHQLSLEFQQ